MANGFEIPTLRIYRPVINLHGDVFDRMIDVANNEGVEVPDNIRSKHIVNLIGPHELIGIYERLGHEPDVDEIDDLGDYISENLPESTDKRLIVPTLPVVILPAANRRSRTAVSLGSNNPQIRAETRISHQLLEEGMNVANVAESLGSMPPNVYIGRYAGNSDGVKSAKFIEFLNNYPDLLPTNLIMGAVKVDTLLPAEE